MSRNVVQCPHCGASFAPIAHYRRTPETAAVYKAIEGQNRVVVRQLKDALPSIPSKTIYNVLGYLTRQGRLVRLFYGVYVTPAGPRCLTSP